MRPLCRVRARRGGRGARARARVRASAAALPSAEHARSRLLAHARPAAGFVNAIEISRASRRFAVAAVGMEHRLGRWFVDTDVRNGIAVVQLPAALSDEPDDQQGSTSDAGEQDDDSDDVAG